MKITSLQENFKSGILIASHIAGKNVNLPILNNVMIEAKDGNIRLITTDLEVGITATVRGKIEKEGVFTVDSKVVSEFIALLPNKKVEIERKDSNLLIKSENYKTVVRGQEADEFPLIPKVERKEYFKAEANEFRKALSQVIFAVSNSETRIELTGVQFYFSGDKLIMAATDSYRLAEKEIKIKTNSKTDKKIIIPAKTLQELIRIMSAVKNENLSEESEDIEFYVNDNQILFIIGNTELVSRLIEGQYPDYKQIIPSKSETSVSVNRDELVRAVKAASIFSKSGVNDVNLDFPLGKNKIIISSSSSQTGENITELEAAVNGKDNGIVVNFRYLLDGVNNIEGDTIKLGIIDGNTPCVLKSEKDLGYIYIIMPIKQ
ncbi:MAG: DNA polymerase III subunit beta [Parcubacteria group bacterium ADurb.Bin316]|nr:MAG: DNA polymerase III subunit beta [Parcubacteria group bacterium ADurb.Bin316]HOZ55695.1 DNA polymerase III subunit beta [bacterium]